MADLAYDLLSRLEVDKDCQYTRFEHSSVCCIINKILLKEKVLTKRHVDL